MLEIKIDELIEALNRITQAINEANSCKVVIPEKEADTVITTIDKPKRKRRTKAEMEADKAAEKAEVSPLDKLATDAMLSVAPASKEIPTIEQIRAAASALVDMDKSEAQRGLQEAMNILKTFDCSVISEISEDKRQEALDKFNKAVKTWKN